ncbi:MAG: molecular chaperone TorD family protein [Thiomargarita sp.]|nr:molecular chaperone TorD family protein [Thiomargarita sp.]
MTQPFPTSPLSNTTPPPQPIKWFKNEKTAEWTKADSITLLAQADLLLFIAQMFAPPSAELQKMLEIEVPDIKELLQKSGFSEPNRFEELFQQIRQQAQGLDTWAGEYNRLFETNVACPINETGIIRRDKGVILADITGFYHAFGFKLSEEATEKADHLTGELEFVAMLLVMLAQTQDEEALRTIHHALNSFSFDHIGEWLPMFCERLTEATSLPFYQHLAKLLQGVWNEVVAINSLPIPEGEMMELPEDEGTPYECDMAEKM